MPSYAFLCGACGHRYDDFFGFSQDMPGACPQCGEPYGRDFNQDYTQNRPVGRVYGADSMTTVGQQAEYNAKKMGKEQLQMKLEEFYQPTPYTGYMPDGAGPTAPAKTPWFRDGSVPGLAKSDRPLDLKEVKDVEKYVMTGDKR